MTTETQEYYINTLDLSEESYSEYVSRIFQEINNLEIINDSQMHIENYMNSNENCDFDKNDVDQELGVYEKTYSLSVSDKSLDLLENNHNSDFSFDDYRKQII